MKLKDEQYGGYYGEVGYDLNISSNPPKGGIATARLLWSFAAAYRITGDSQYAQHARHAYQFLSGPLYDQEHEGIYWAVDYQGNPLDTRKHVYNQAFAIYAFSEYYRATGEEEALQLSIRLFRWLEQTGYNHQTGAYREEFDRFWQEQPNEMLSENGVIADITMNTHIHILEAYTNLYRVWPDEQVHQALDNLLLILHDRMYDPQLRRLNVFFDNQWNSLLDLTSFGHDIEASWLIDDAMQVIGNTDPVYQQMVIDMAYRVAEVAIQPDGSLMNEQENDHIDTSRIWWVQAEAVVGFYNAYQRTGDNQFLQLIDKLWAYIKVHIIDPRPGGEWFWSADDQGEPGQREVAGMWKCPYHNSRFCIEITERMN
ncbi:N-acylglucosamine 2-epimerase [Paenibacillus bovis]|uniref:Cellobiose 2-epimerase n=2 Tax=Paenibacillus bovis TaxID=1616788 RepID=A0A172ZMJ8_9BACL|nr:N-acylglucosamine 2-epimerase [Paenibacillus bovis]